VHQFRTESAEETEQFGKELSRQLPGHGVVLLTGNLGAGKTTLAKGIIEGLGLASGGDVTSPTYTLVHEYGEPVRVYHIDLYRLDTTDEVKAIGLEEMMERDALLLIEWGERFPEVLPVSRIEVRLQTAEDESRTIEITGMDDSKLVGPVGLERTTKRL
jgi:tRNA threonylcarbamoyladenosine biosynthesis protein TsaE